MRILVACEYSGAVRDAFSDLGHDAISCDLLPTDKPGQHYQGDIWHMLCSPQYSCGFDLAVCHPPCTFLSNSGVRWLYNTDGSINKERWDKMEDAAIFFRSMLNINSDRIAVENPIMHKFALRIIGVRPSQIIQPWQFGHGETKATCLWLKGLPKLKPTNIVSGREQRIWKLPPTEDRWKIRSTTFEGIAKAMAAQWGNAKIPAQQLQLL